MANGMDNGNSAKAKRTFLPAAVTAVAAALTLFGLAGSLASASTQGVPAPAKVVTPATYVRAESDRSFYNFQQSGGGVNQFFKIRKPTPLDGQTVVRMNRDTMYSAATVDTSKGATITVPKVPPGRYFSVLLMDNDHYTPGVIYTSGTHKLPQGTKYLAALVRIQVLRPNDPEDIALVNRLQDQFVITAGSADPFPKPNWDNASLEALTIKYNREFAKYDKYPDGWMAARGAADEKTRQFAAAGAWGLFPNKDAVYINYNPKQPASACYSATYQVPENKGFWSITVYGADGYMKSENSVLNALNAKLNADGSVTAYFGSKADCHDAPNRLDISDGWNFLMRVYRPGKSVLDGTYKLPNVKRVSDQA